MDADIFLTVPTSYRRSTVSILYVLVKNDCYSDILNEFQEVTTPFIKKCRLLGKVEHHIDTRCRRTVFARARRLSPDKLAAAKGVSGDGRNSAVEFTLVVTGSHVGETVRRIASLRRLQSDKCSLRG